MCSGDQSLILEVTDAGEVVWRYINPVSGNGLLQQGDTLRDNYMGRVLKYGGDYPGLSGKDLTPGVTLGIKSESDSEIPNGFVLYNNYPNPFNAGTKIRFELSEISFISINIYDITGRLLNTLVNESVGAGSHEVFWNGSDRSGRLVSSGIYIYVLQVDQSTTSKKMLMLK